MNVINNDIINVPNNGNRSIGFIPSRACGSELNNFLSPSTK